MFGFFRRWLIEKLLYAIRTNECVRKEIVRICEEYYVNHSLHVCRLWGGRDRLRVGRNVQLNNAILNTVSGSITINDYTFLGHSVSLLTGSHDVTKIDLERQIGVPSEGRDIVIGRGVWIASNATVLGPCMIGDYAVIGAGAVVTGDIPPNSFFAGVPAKLVKKLALAPIADHI